jgi:hypothetical protein
MGDEEKVLWEARRSGLLTSTQNRKMSRRLFPWFFPAQG